MMGNQDRTRTLDLLRSLADETRFRILPLIADSPVPLSAQQVAKSLSLHPNTIRPHLERLRDAGFLDLVISSDGRVGRPQHLYRLAPDAPRFGVEPGAHEEIASIMVETLVLLVENLNASAEQAAEVGRAWGRRLERDAVSRSSRLPGSNGDPAAATALFDESARLGFEPTRSDNEVFFNDCPFRELVSKYPEVACAAHEGICEGIIGVVGTEAVKSVFSRRGTDEACSMAIGDTALEGTAP